MLTSHTTSPAVSHMTSSHKLKTSTSKSTLALLCECRFRFVVACTGAGRVSAGQPFICINCVKEPLRKTSNFYWLTVTDLENLPQAGLLMSVNGIQQSTCVPSWTQGSSLLHSGSLDIDPGKVCRSSQVVGIYKNTSLCQNLGFFYRNKTLAY